MSNEKKCISDKTIRLVEYLTALVKINVKIVRSLDDYRKILWIHSIPREQKHCFTKAWGLEEDYDEDIWLEVKKFQEPELPQIPEKCQGWVKRETLRDTRELPELYETINIVIVHPYS